MFCSPFPTVAEAVQEELEDYKTKEDEVRRLKRAMVIILIHSGWNYISTAPNYISSSFIHMYY